MIEPWVDVQADLDAINRGEAIVDHQHATAWINGRLWGFHTDTGTAYPMEGKGFVRLNQLQFFALRTIARYNGLNARSEATLNRHPDLTDEDREIVRRLWRMREEAEG